MVSLSQVFTLVTLTVLHVESNLLGANLKLATMHCWAMHKHSLQCYAAKLAWREEETFPCALLNNINGSAARSKMTDVLTRVMKKRQRLSSGDWTISALRNKYVNWILHHMQLGCIILLCETLAWQLPHRWTHMKMLPLQQNILGTNWMTETCRYCLRFWYGKCVKWGKNLFHCELYMLHKLEIFLCVVILKGQHVH
jgi:hypothetical protein